MTTDTARQALAELMKCEYIQRQERNLARGLGTATWLGKTILAARSAISESSGAAEVKKFQVFDEKALEYEIHRIWGPAGAHADVFYEICKKAGIKL